MNKIDVRLSAEEITMLTSCKGKVLQCYCHEEFCYTNTSSQVVSIKMSDENELFIYSFAELKDYFGVEEDVAIWTLTNERLPILSHKHLLETPVMEEIKGVTLVQENQRVFRNNEQIYDVWLTRGIIIDFADRQVAFEKAIWFSEEIIVHRGYNLIDMFASKDRFGKDWDKLYRTECSREIVTL